MYLKRTSKLLDLSSRSTADVHLRDLMCPVCRGILIEPVTLPCTHNLCLRCLKGTFEHNSLSCPLCRVRVGSWLRNATKSETLVNHGLWELIRAKFPKEIENKHNGEEGDLSLDADYTTKRILSAAGEIHREYEAQLQMAEEEMRRQRQAEQIASEALIQKIRVEEQQLLLAQLAQDQLLAKTLAKQQVVKKHKEATKCYNQCLNASVSNYVLDASRFNTKTMLVNNVEMPQTEAAHLEGRQMSLAESVSDSTKPRQTNTTLLSKIETICSNIYGSNETDASSMHKVSLKYCCQKQIPVYNAVTKTLKHKTVSKFTQPCTSNYSMDPGCSTSKAYMTETKEELRIPSDVVNSKKKSLGIEVCMTLADDDERIGSAESSGSHDSINQEIHHFKPIKTVPRTKLKVSSDGKQIDPKLIRVIPVLKKASNAVPKPPSPTHMKRIIGCSWSAFRGRIKQDAKEKQAPHNLEDTKTLIDQQPSTSLDHSQMISNKSMTKPQTNDVIRRLDFVPESSFDSNKNYTKNANKIINGLKTSKNLDESDAKKTRKSWRTRVRNGMIVKSKGYRNLRSNKRAAELSLNVIDEEEDDPMDSFGKVSPQNDEQDSDRDDVAVENIAERIKRRKENIEKETRREIESNTSKKSKATMKKKTLSERRDESPATNHVLFSTIEESAEVEHTGSRRTKRRKISRISQSNTEDLERIEFSSDASKVNLRKSTRNLTKVSKSSDHLSNVVRNKNNSRFNYDSPPESSDETEECVPESNHVVGTCVKELPSDKEAIEEQQRIERLLLQEKEDFELARRLQAQFDEMERIAGRPRRTRKTTENERSIETDATGTVFKRNVKRKSAVDCAVSTVVKRKRGRPSKRVKIATDTQEDETSAR
ncbi:uncharacterized protein LOC126854012 isoform X1 [Cataglyphis hispanica]|uniref:uncharacterized protein LOC126854012 isoform X1 n=2 Tax=Cataglyphis hispanica TaxID=1086592 RepID=UPI0021800797|nr:uncharacterized protein LOC126854012 isoform X1 [Cataglyphis hispanica]